MIFVFISLIHIKCKGCYDTKIYHKIGMNFRIVVSK